MVCKALSCTRAVIIIRVAERRSKRKKMKMEKRHPAGSDGQARGISSIQDRREGVGGGVKWELHRV